MLRCFCHDCEAFSLLINEQCSRCGGSFVEIVNDDRSSSVADLTNDIPSDAHQLHLMMLEALSIFRQNMRNNNIRIFRLMPHSNIGNMETIGDYAISDNSFDRIVTRLLEQHSINMETNFHGLTANQINALPQIQIDPKFEAAVCEQCTICQDSFRNGDKTYFLDCFHQFHQECLEPWVRRVASCPTCRSKIIS